MITENCEIDSSSSNIHRQKHNLLKFVIEMPKLWLCQGIRLQFEPEFFLPAMRTIALTFQRIVRLSIFVSILLVVFSLFSQSTSALDSKNESEVATETAEEADTVRENSIWGDLTDLGLLILLQAVLGFDNLLYISLESKNAPPEKQKSVRAWGIGLAIGLRIVLLFALYYSIELFEKIFLFEIDWPTYVEGHFNIHSLIVLAGGAFILYTAMKEIWHMTRFEHADHLHGESKRKSAASAIFWIMAMNVVFSFDSILTAIQLADSFWVMATAVVLSGLAMIWLSDHVSEFLSKNRMYEVLGLFVLFVVGIMLVSEGGHLAHLNLFGSPVEAMSKTTFYFVIVVLVLTDIVQSRYQKKLLAAGKKADADPTHA